MKRLVLVLTTVGLILGLAIPAFSQPFTPDIANDTYGIAQGGGNIINVPTPDDDNDNLAGTPNPADINDAVNLLLNTNYAHNSDVDYLQWTAGDNSWKDLSTLDSTGTYIAISLTAGNTNSLNVYDVATPGTKLQVLPGLTGFGFIGDGTSTNPLLAGFSPLAAGTDFGWALFSDSTGTDYMWDSNPVNNADKLDHMLTYHLASLASQTVWIRYNCGIDPIDIDGTPDYSACTEEEYTFNDPYLIVWEDLPYLNGKLGDEDYDDMIFLVDRVKPIIPEPASLVLLASGLLGILGLKKRKI